MSHFQSEHEKLQSLVSDLRPIIISINDEIDKLEDASSSVELKDLSTAVRKSLNKAHSIVDDFSDFVSQLESSISKMEGGEQKTEEQKKLNELMESQDGPSPLKLNPVSLENTVSKLNKRFSRAFETCTMVISGLSRIPSIAPSTSAGPSQFLPSTISQSDNSSSVLSHKPNIVLPPIKLECFDGSDITKWPAYKYQLDMLILDQPHLNEVEKACYVRSSLKGTAFSLVSSIPTNKNFLGKIIDRLTQEYGRKNLTQATLLQSLFQIRSKSNRLDDQISTVRSMINIVNTIDTDCGLDGLVTQQQMAERINNRFIPIVWRNSSDTLLGSLQRIEEILRSELEDVTMINAFSDRSHSSTIAAVANGVNKPKLPRYSTEGTQASNPSPKPTTNPTCVYCGRHEYSGECTAVQAPKDRKEILRKKSLCYCCFSPKHNTNDCRRKCTNCSGKHHRSICEKASPFTNHSLVSPTRELQRLFTASVIVDNPNLDTPRSARAFIHLDHGSQATIISRDLVNRLSLVPFDNREMTLIGINGVSIPSLYDIVKVNVVTTKGNVLLEAVVQDRKCINTIYTEPLPADDLLVIQDTIGQVPRYISERTPLDIDMLLSIGDTLELLENAQETRLPCGYRLVQSIIGPIVVGSNRPPPPTTVCSVVSALTSSSPTEDESLESKVERLFSVDPAARLYETTEKESRRLSNELVTQHFHDTVEKQGDDYVVQYSIKPEAKTELPSNYDLAASRLASTLKTLSKQRTNLEFYDSILKDQLSLGQIEMVDPDDTDGIIHYLAHQPVLRPDKPSTPLRIVYDGSAHLKNKPSLNDMIHTGPSDLEQIPALFIRARSRFVLIIADVEKAFLQVKLHLSQRNMLRFLWVKDIDKPVTKTNILIYRFCVTPFGINQSPCLLNMVINHHIQHNSAHCDPELVHQLVSNLYVDNVIINVDSPHSTMFDQAKGLFDTMGMNLRDFASNNPDFIQSIPELNKSKDDMQKLLGILWNTITDQLSIKIPITVKGTKETKRSMLSAVSSPYDPLGLLNPLTLPPRLTIQNLWNESLKWDDPVNDSTRDTFHDQMRDLENFSLSIDRYSHLSDCDEIILVAFSDASKHAMATCVYSWSPFAKPTLLISKTRLAPIKSKSTIPKMELESLVMAHSLLRFTVEALRKEFPNKPIHVYTYSDSAVVLHWCKPEFSKPLGIFVTNRVKKINETREELVALHPVVYHTPRHVRSECNPADHATRGLTAKSMNDPNHQWWKGPDWLINDPCSWPNDDLSLLQYPMDSFPMIVSAVSNIPSIDTVIDLSRFSSLRKAISVTATVYRFLSRCAARTNNPSIIVKLSHLPDSIATALTAAEKRFAGISLIRLYQTKYIGRYESLIKTNSIVQDGSSLWRKSSRLTNSKLETETKSPIFIPTLEDSTLAKHLIREIHLSSSHSNLDVVLNQLKRSYWIPKCRQIAKTVLKRCVPCRKTNNLPFRYPPSNPLPSDRVIQTRPFEHCGLDYAGPFLSKNDEKMYVVVFTCFSSRLSHLEIVTSLLPSSFILAFRRFCSRRGTPSKITSDQATTFKLASSLFTKPDEDPNVNTLLSNMGVEWSFTTAHSPWKGGIYERLVKIIKESLTRTIGRKKQSFEEFSTIICEIEALLNSRPLTYVSSDDGISFTGPSLRPIDLISPHSFLGCSVIVRDIDSDYMPPDEENSSRETALKQLKRSVDTVDAFWKRWHSEYLITLRDSASKSDPLHSTRSTTILPIRGSIVLVVDESGVNPRSSWKMARILSLTENSATLKSHTGRIIERPLNLLIPLEIHSQDDPSLDDSPVVMNKKTPPNSHSMATRSKKAPSRN